MGINYYKVQYDCDCGENHGSCGKKSAFYIRLNRACDISEILHKHDLNNPDEKPEHLGAWNKSDLDALRNILYMEQTNFDYFTDLEKQQLKL